MKEYEDIFQTQNNINNDIPVNNVFDNQNIEGNNIINSENINPNSVFPDYSGITNEPSLEQYNNTNNNLFDQNNVINSVEPQVEQYNNINNNDSLNQSNVINNIELQVEQYNNINNNDSLNQSNVINNIEPSVEQYNNQNIENNIQNHSNIESNSEKENINYNPMEHPDAKIVLNKNVEEPEKEHDPEVENIKVFEELKSNRSLIFVLSIGLVLFVITILIPHISKFIK